MGQVSAKLRRVTNGYAHWCPGCEQMHIIQTDAPRENGAQWGFNGDMDRPTFTPSVNIMWGSKVDPANYDYGGACHYLLTGGRLLFCGDSTHKLGGKQVDLPDIPAAYRDRGNMT